MRSALPALALVVLLVTSGCVGIFQSPPPPSDQRALDVLNRSQAAVGDVSSYTFTLDGGVDASKGDEAESFDLNGEGVVDVQQQRLNATTRSDGADRSTYIDGFSVYTECSRVGWERENASRSDPWLEHTPLGQQLAILEETNVYWRGTETVNGTETAVVVAYPTKNDLQAVADEQGVGGPDFQQANLKNVTVTMWFDTETNRPVRSSLEVRVKRGGATATATMTFQYSGYDDQVTVSRPAFDEDSLWEVGCPGS